MGKLEGKGSGRHKRMEKMVRRKISNFNLTE